MIIPRDWLLWRVKKNLLYKGVQCQANGFSIFSWEHPENGPIVPDICLLLVLTAGAGPRIITSLSAGPWVSGQHLTHHPDRSQLLDLAQGWLLSGFQCILINDWTSCTSSRTFWNSDGAAPQFHGLSGWLWAVVSVIWGELQFWESLWKWEWIASFYVEFLLTGTIYWLESLILSRHFLSQLIQIQILQLPPFSVA